MSESLSTLDVRPILEAGGEPFAEIMKATSSLEPGQGLRLLVSFRPVPLFSVMEGKGYSHCERELDGGDWEIIFRPVGTAGASTAAPGAGAVDDIGAWPAPVHALDLRGMMPPDPMVITLETIEGMNVGEVMEGCYDRDPLLLYPELEARGHHFHCEKRGPSEYRVRIRRAASQEGAP